MKMKMKIMLMVIMMITIQSKYQKHKKNKKHKKTPKGPKSMINVPLYAGFPFPTSYNPSNKDPSLYTMMVVDSQGNIVKSTVDRTKLNKPYRFCHLLDPEPFQICQNIKDCESCSRIPKCGWCAASQKCISAAEDEPNCPEDCLSTFVFDWSRCGGNIKAGMMTNIAKDATSLKQPEIINNDAKIRLNTYQTKYAVREEKTQVGVAKRLNSLKTVNVDRMGQDQQVINSESVPLYGKRVIRIPIKNELVSSKVMNIDTGEYTYPVKEPPTFHGTSTNNESGTPINEQNTNLAEPDPQYTWGVNIKKRKKKK